MILKGDLHLQRIGQLCTRQNTASLKLVLVCYVSVLNVIHDRPSIHTHTHTLHTNTHTTHTLHRHTTHTHIPQTLYTHIHTLYTHTTHSTHNIHTTQTLHTYTHVHTHTTTHTHTHHRERERERERGERWGGREKREREQNLESVWLSGNSSLLRRKTITERSIRTVYQNCLSSGLKSRLLPAVPYRQGDQQTRARKTKG